MNLPAASIIWMGIRPKTLTMALMPVFIGYVLTHAQGEASDWVLLLVICLSALSIQIATNLHNDAQDHLNGTDTSNRLGPQRITQSGLASAVQTKNTAYLFFGMAALCGAYLIIIGGWPVALIGGASILAAYGYSGGPFPISRGPLGELFVLIFFGILAVSGSSFLFSGQWTHKSVLFGLFVGLPASAVLLLNNYRDLEDDTLAGRRTLAILLGNKGARIGYSAFMLAPFLMLPSLSSSFIPYLGLPLCLLVILRVYRITDKKALNGCLGLSAMSQIVNGVLLMISIYY